MITIQRGGRLLRYYPELLTPDYESPRTNLQSILQRLAQNDEDLLRRQ